MRYLLLISLLLCVGCLSTTKQTEAVKVAVEDNNNQTNKISKLIYDMTKSTYEADPTNPQAAINYSNAKQIVSVPLPSQIHLPPVVPAEVVKGGLGLIGQLGIGGGALTTLTTIALGLLANKHKKDAKKLIQMDKEESQTYAKERGLA